MRALVAGERQASLGIVAGLVGMLCLLAVSTGLAIYGMSNLAELRDTLSGRCEKRLQLDKSYSAAVQANAEFYATLEAIAAEAPIRPDVDARTRALYERQKTAISKARTDAEAARAAGVLGSCDAYR